IAHEPPVLAAVVRPPHAAGARVGRRIHSGATPGGLLCDHSRQLVRGNLDLRVDDVWIGSSEVESNTSHGADRQATAGESSPAPAAVGALPNPAPVAAAGESPRGALPRVRSGEEDVRIRRVNDDVGSTAIRVYIQCLV